MCAHLQPVGEAAAAEGAPKQAKQASSTHLQPVGEAVSTEGAVNRKATESGLAGVPMRV